MPLSFIKHLTQKIARLKRDGATSEFIRHNKNVFRRQSNLDRTAPIVLMESNNMHSAHVAYSYFANVFAIRHNARIKAYLPVMHSSFIDSAKFAVRRVLRAREFGVFHSFGAGDCIVPRLTSLQTKKASQLFDAIRAKLKSKVDVESIEIDGVWIGDLIYDSYMRENNEPTIDLTAPKFHISLRHSISLLVYWTDFFEAHHVAAINVSHCVYDAAIPLRVALQRGVPAYQASATHVYRMNRDNMFAYTDFRYFRERFATLPAEQRAAGLKEAESRIKRRFAGEVGVDMAYSTKSAYGAPKSFRLLKESSKKKVLVATHCFFDNPHGYGNNLFPDFCEWLDFLGQMTEKTDYDWYMKTHADFLPGTTQIINSFLKRYPRFTLLPADSSHHQIIAEGIDVALTVFGSIGFEYAALGVPVINATQNNPHIAYDFNFHPRTIDEYKQLLMNLDRLVLDINHEQVYEFYFMKHIFNNENWLFSNMDETVRKLGGYAEQFTTKVYDKWLEEWSPTRHREIIGSLEQFIDSGDFRIDSRHRLGARNAG